MSTANHAEIVLRCPLPAAAMPALHKFFVQHAVGTYIENPNRPGESLPIWRFDLAGFLSKYQGIANLEAKALPERDAGKLLDLAKAHGFDCIVHIQWTEDYESNVQGEMSFYDAADGRELRGEMAMNHAHEFLIPFDEVVGHSKDALMKKYGLPAGLRRAPGVVMKSAEGAAAVA
jgi:hypothetical protein